MGISQVYKVFSFPWWSFAAFKAHFRGFELRAEGWERWRGEKRRGGGEEEGQWARILNITYANIQIAKCWSFPHSAFRMEISQVCKAFSFPCWSFAAFKAHLSRFRACWGLWITPCNGTVWNLFQNQYQYRCIPQSSTNSPIPQSFNFCGYFRDVLCSC